MMMAAKVAVNSSESATTPGKMKRRYSAPPRPGVATDPRPQHEQIQQWLREDWSPGEIPVEPDSSQVQSEDGEITVHANPI